VAHARRPQLNLRRAFVEHVRAVAVVADGLVRRSVRCLPHSCDVRVPSRASAQQTNAGSGCNSSGKKSEACLHRAAFVRAPAGGVSSSLASLRVCRIVPRSRAPSASGMLVRLLRSGQHRVSLPLRWCRDFGLWRSLVAHLTGGQGVAGSNPVSPTNETKGRRMAALFLVVLSVRTRNLLVGPRRAGPRAPRSGVWGSGGESNPVTRPVSREEEIPMLVEPCRQSGIRFRVLFRRIGRKFSGKSPQAQLGFVSARNRAEN
jgi:hypothetical protein